MSKKSNSNPMELPSVPRDADRCRAIKSNGKRCRGWAGLGGLCPNHQPGSLYQHVGKRPSRKPGDIPYAVYLQSDHWQKRRLEALNYYGCRCVSCGAEDVVLDVHHLSYERQWHEHDDDLVVLCGNCHAGVHR